jgi:hypothetical protein
MPLLSLMANHSRTPEIKDAERFSEETNITAVMPVVKVPHSLDKPAFRGHSGSEEPGMANIVDTSAKIVRTASLGTVLESGKKTLARLNQGSLALQRQRSESPDRSFNSGTRNFPVTRGCVPERLEADDAEMEERRMLRNRTRKIGRVLGETLKEDEVGQHVVASGRARREGDTSESTSIDGDSVETTTRLSTLHEGASQLRLSLGPPPFENDDHVKKLLLPSEQIAAGDNPITDQRLSIPLSPTIDGMRRHSDPTSPMYPSSMNGESRVDSSQVAETEIQEEHTIEEAKRQRRIRLDKVGSGFHILDAALTEVLLQLNRLLGVHVPLALLGPAVYPKRAALSRERPADQSDDESEAAQAARKKRAVKVASKMFNVSPLPHWS